MRFRVARDLSMLSWSCGWSFEKGGCKVSGEIWDRCFFFFDEVEMSDCWGFIGVRLELNVIVWKGRLWGFWRDLGSEDLGSFGCTRFFLYGSGRGVECTFGFWRKVFFWYRFITDLVWVWIDVFLYLQVWKRGDMGCFLGSSDWDWVYWELCVYSFSCTEIRGNVGTGWVYSCYLDERTFIKRRVWFGWGFV